MPVTPNSGSPLPTVNAVMNVARARVGDMLDSVDGTLLTNDAPYSQTFLSSAFKWYQNKCANAGVELQVRETTLFGVPARSTDDVAYQCFITWMGCSDGAGEYDTPALPADLVNPLSVWRRQSGTQSGFRLMSQAKDGLPRVLDTNVYDWRENGFYFYGSQYLQDFLFRYSTYWADLNLMEPDSLVPMLGCENSLGARVAYEYANARNPGSAGTTSLAQMAESSFDEAAAQRTSRRKQRSTFRRKPYGCAGDNYSGGYGIGWPVPLGG